LKETKDKKLRINSIYEEICSLWIDLNFPQLSKQVIIAKLKSLIEKYEKNRKRRTNAFKAMLLNIFDITKVDGFWLSSEDKKLYSIQLKSRGKIGYSTKIAAPTSSIHPSKRRKINDDKITVNNKVIYSSDTMKTDESGEEADACINEKKYAKASTCSDLVSKESLSTYRVASVLRTLSKSMPEKNIPTPSQSGIWRSVMKKGEDMKEKVKNIIKNDLFCLHFDGKRISSTEYQVVCLQSIDLQINLGALKCTDGSANSIFNEVNNLLTNFDAFSRIKMIITDGTAVNTGSKNGVVQKLKNLFKNLDLNEPQFVTCQLHILDLSIKHILNAEFPNRSSSPEIHYEFVEILTKNYEELCKNYKTEEHETLYDDGKTYRDDYKFLFELCAAFRSFLITNRNPYVKWRKLPCINAARWNSRASYTIIAFFLLPQWRQRFLNIICYFIL